MKYSWACQKYSMLTTPSLDVLYFYITTFSLCQDFKLTRHVKPDLPRTLRGRDHFICEISSVRFNLGINSQLLSLTDLSFIEKQFLPRCLSFHLITYAVKRLQ